MPLLRRRIRFLLGWHKRKLSTGSNKPENITILQIKLTFSDRTFLLSSTLKLSSLRSYKSVQVGFAGLYIHRARYNQKRYVLCYGFAWNLIISRVYSLACCWHVSLHRIPHACAELSTCINYTTTSAWVMVSPNGLWLRVMY